MRLIIAEDNETSRLILEAVTRKWGYEVTAYRNGTEVWQAMQNATEPQLVILDWMMPGLTGLDVCRMIREHEKSMPSYIFLLTACDSQEEKVKGLENGANDYITKPFDKDELRARLRVGERVLDLQRRLASKIDELEHALQEIKTLRGVVTICMHCHKMLNDSKSWDKLEKYVEEHSEAQFSHGICPDCLDKFYPDPEAEENNSEESPSESKVTSAGG